MMIRTHQRRILLQVRSNFQWNLSSSSLHYDAVIVGGGHNGLVSAAYLAKSGKKVCVLERRHVVGGAAVTEEIVPGYKFSRASYLLSLMRPQIIRDLELKKHGLKVYMRNPSSFTPIAEELQKEFGGQKYLTLGANAEENKREIAKFSALDAERYEEYEEQLNSFVDIIDPLLDSAPADLKRFNEAGLFSKLSQLQNDMKPVKQAALSALKTNVTALYELITAPSQKVLDKWFESDVLKATLATDASIGAMCGPSTPGGGYVLLHHVMGELEGVRGAWGYPRGGMGAVSAAIASSAQEAGAEIKLEKNVQEILIEGNVAKGVKLDGGEVITADVVMSNATPKVTFEKLIDERSLDKDFLHSVRQIDYTSPVTKINVAVNKLPNFSASPNVGDGPMPHHQATIHLNCERMSMLEDAYQDCLSGGISRRPMIEMTMPSALDDSLAPPGHHVCLFFTQYTPYKLQNGLEWDDDAREAYAKVIFDTVEKYAPGFKESVVGKEVLTPPDLERTFGLTGGNIFHGSMSLDQLYFSRPVTGKDLSPATPVKGLILCGSGGHPGGGVMGAPGRLASKEALKAMGGKWKFG